MNTNENKKIMEKALKIIRAKAIYVEFTAEALAKELGISKAQILKTFKTFAGMEPRAFIRNFRLERSIILFKSTKYSVSEIASQSGFKSLSYFSFCFKQTFNCTPSEFRKNEEVLNNRNASTEIIDAK